MIVNIKAESVAVSVTSNEGTPLVDFNVKDYNVMLNLDELVDNARLLLANIAMAAAEHFRPGDQRLDRLTKAMAVTAYQEVLQQFDIEQMIEDLISNKTIAKALKAVDVDPA